MTSGYLSAVNPGIKKVALIWCLSSIVAVIFCGFISTFSCLLGTGALTWFVNASSFSVVIMYLLVVLSFILLRKRQPLLPRPYKVKRFVPVSIIAMLVVLFFTYLYLPMGPSSLNTIEWSMLIGWFAIGGTIAALCLSGSKRMPVQEREKTLTISKEG